MFSTNIPTHRAFSDRHQRGTITVIPPQKLWEILTKSLFGKKIVFSETSLYFLFDCIKRLPKACRRRWNVQQFRVYVTLMSENQSEGSGWVCGRKFNPWRLPKILFIAQIGESTQYQETLIYCNLFGWERRRTGDWTASFLVSGPVWVCNLCRASSQFTAGLQNNLSSNAGQSISPFHAILCTKEKKKKKKWGE